MSGTGDQTNVMEISSDADEGEGKKVAEEKEISFKF